MGAQAGPRSRSRWARCQARLIDAYQLVVNPIVLGKGRTMFDGVKDKLELKCTKTRAFKNGNVVLWYEAKA